jgi:hypothetical protein
MAAVDASVVVDGLVAVVSAVPLAAVGVAVPTAVDVVFGHGCGRSNFRGGDYGRGTGLLVAAIT